MGARTRGKETSHNQSIGTLFVFLKEKGPRLGMAKLDLI